MTTLLAEAQTHKPWTVKHRRHIHQNPELSLQEKSTAAHCMEVMRSLGYSVKPCWGEGFTADLELPASLSLSKGAGSNGAPTDPSTGSGNRSMPSPSSPKRIAIRCDMDALPILELNTHAYVSCKPGVAHMCGHDTHMAIAMTAAKIIADNRGKMAASVRFLFQPCEETPPGGALGMIANGCLDGVDEVFGLHNDPGTLIGRVRLRAGAMTAAADRFQLTVRGRGCHAARPQDGLDPIPAMCGIVQEWQTIISRRLDPVHPAVVSVTQFNAGTTFNIIPDTATICGTVRTFHESDRKMIEQQMRVCLVGLEARGYSCQFEYSRGYDSIVNHASGVKRVADVARRVLDGGVDTPVHQGSKGDSLLHEQTQVAVAQLSVDKSVHPPGLGPVDDNTDPVAWGEDFSYYLQKVPGAFFFLGSGNPMKGITEPLHSARFDVDEDCLPIGAAILAGLVLQA